MVDGVWVWWAYLAMVLFEALRSQEFFVAFLTDDVLFTGDQMLMVVVP